MADAGRIADVPPVLEALADTPRGEVNLDPALLLLSTIAAVVTQLGLFLNDVAIPVGRW